MPVNRQPKPRTRQLGSGAEAFGEPAAEPGGHRHGDVVLRAGIATGTNSQFRLVPTAGAALTYTKARFEGGLLDGVEDDDTYGIISLGLGFVLNTNVSILPSVEIPVGLEDADPGFGIMVAVNFGRGS